MAVEIPNTEPTYAVQWRTHNPDALLRSADKNRKNTFVDNKTPDDNNDRDIIYKNITQKFNNDFKTTVSAFSTVVKAESSFREIKSNLYLMRSAANSVLKHNFDIHQKDKLEENFNNYKQNIDTIYQKNEDNNINFLDLLKNKGITFKLNSEKNQQEITIALNKKNDGITGFNTKGLQVDNLTIKNDKEAKYSIDKIDNAINYIKENERQLNQTQEKIDSLLYSLTNTDKIAQDNFFIEDLAQAKNETQNVADVILGNKDEASKSQANTRYEDYINLLKTTPDLAQQERE